ncbi:phage virion morphogenesis protein, partial [Salmonella enterica]
HHYGLRDRVSRKGPEVRYAERRLLGYSNNCYLIVSDLLMKWLTHR